MMSNYMFQYLFEHNYFGMKSDLNNTIHTVHYESTCGDYCAGLCIILCCSHDDELCGMGCGYRDVDLSLGLTRPPLCV